MGAISENALRFVVALLLASPGLALAQDNRPANDGDVVAWSDTKGLLGNAATVELNGVRFSQNLNNVFYRNTLSASDIINSKSSNPQADRLVQAMAASEAGH